MIIIIISIALIFIIISIALIFYTKLYGFKNSIIIIMKIQTDPLIPARRPKIVITDKKIEENQTNSRICCPGGPQSEDQRKRKERQILRPCQRTKSVMGQESDCGTYS